MTAFVERHKDRFGIEPICAHLPVAPATYITGELFPKLVARPFPDGLRIIFAVALGLLAIAAWASWLRGEKYVHVEEAQEEASLASGSGREPLTKRTTQSLRLSTSARARDHYCRANPDTP